MNDLKGIYERIMDLYDPKLPVPVVIPEGEIKEFDLWQKAFEELIKLGYATKVFKNIESVSLDLTPEGYDYIKKEVEGK